MGTPGNATLREIGQHASEIVRINRKFLPSSAATVSCREFVHLRKKCLTK